MTSLTRLFCAGVFIALSGCASVNLPEHFARVQDQTTARIGASVEWHGITSDDPIEARVAERLEDGLTLAECVQIAVINNARLQAVYEDFGIARAELVRAALPDNPVFHGELLYETSSVQSWELEVVQNVLSLLTVPRRRAIARDNLFQAEQRAIAEVIDVVMDAKRAYLHYQADHEIFALWGEFLLAEQTIYELAGALRAAGNISNLSLTQARTRYDAVKLDYAAVELDLVASREHVNRLMGLFGDQGVWAPAGDLPPVPAGPEPEGVLRAALESSLDVAMARREVEAAARRAGLDNLDTVLAHVEIGASFESDEPETGSRDWEVGPTLSMPIPVFDQGQTGRAIRRAEMRRAWDEFTAVAAELRSAVRSSVYQLAVSRGMAHYHDNAALPAAQDALREAELQYNGMFIGPEELLRAKQEEVRAHVNAVTARQDFWLAQTDVDQLVAGRMVIRAPEDRPDIIGADVRHAAANGGGGHE